MKTKNYTAIEKLIVEKTINVKRTALERLANFFKIPNWNIKSNDEIMGELDSLTDHQAETIMMLLKNYFKAYDAWVEFYQNIKKEDKKYFLTDKQQSDMQALIKKREVELNKLQEEFDQLQLYHQQQE